MDGYHIALVIHFFALMSASGASALVHFAETRFERAEKPAEALQWLKMTGNVAKIFPMAVITLFLTGAYMTAAFGAWTWGTGFVQAGVTAVVLLMASGATVGGRMRKVGMAIGALMQRGCTRQELVACHDPVASALIWMNTALALSVVIVMTLKPTPVVAFSILLVGSCTGLALNRARAARPAVNLNAAME